ncbi:outer membrane protein assembly factor BamA [Volucribacter amazonae]|uniref:Outer membrane protein assembly factor BamA n=1 Tax=Volucribacter amazonae TaxID=256731 RepID=A0A9X4PCP2_9PAST|nr:outer membrane protein assembly factor BamA [Volucribacter amazonae]MDG6894936.1 outer membrane protein assembly factor BamA [Volucribacter amazonae]
MKKLLITSLLFGATGSALAAPFVVQDIRVEGVQPSTERNIIASLPVRVGQRATDNDIANVVRTMFLQNAYEDVRASRDGNTLVISVVERPVIADIVIEGNKAVPTEALKQNLEANGIATGEILNNEKLAAFSQSLEEHYRSVGRYDAKVETVINRLPNNRAEVKLVIKENDIAILKQITFHGNEHFSDSKLLEQIELQPDAWWKLWGNKFEQQKFELDLETLRNFYLNQGYAKFQITSTDVQIQPSEIVDGKQKDTMVEVTINMNEGVQYRVIAARIVGDTAGMSTELLPALQHIEVGEIFRGSDINTVEEAIKAKLGERGYATATINLHPEFDDQNHTVALTFVVDAGRSYSVRRIRFEGNDVSADSTLRQEMRQQEGTWLSSSLLELGKVRLERTGFFETVDYKTVPVEGTDDQLDVVYKVKERNTGSINFGIGYGTESGLSYQASIKQDNFLGMGSSVSLSGSRNKYGTSISLGYNEPYFTKDGVSLGGNVFYETYDNSDNDTIASYSRTTYGLNGTLGFPVNENNAFYLGAGYTYNKLKNVYPEYNRSLYLESMNFDSWKFKASDFDVSFGWNYNSLNRGYFPTSGVKATLGGRVTAPGSDNKYYKLNFDATGFYPLNRDHTWVLSGKVGANYADGFGGKRLPFYQNYTAGGLGSLRGFAYGGVGPQAIYMSQSSVQSGNCGGVSVDKSCYDYINGDVVGGNAMATASVELIFPTPFVADKNQRSVRTSVFVDAASVWNTHWKKDKEGLSTSVTTVDYGDPTRVRASAGVALQWQSPIGPLVFSYAKPIKKYDGDEIEQFQFSIGGTF